MRPVLYKDFQMICLDVQSSCLKAQPAQPAQPGNVQLHVEVADVFFVFRSKLWLLLLIALTTSDEKDQESVHAAL